jgi:BirA family transcriptional regulator, biotin operon repressor / biotin---[acetyl-CoA-carboxylase] ligase
VTHQLSSSILKLVHILNDCHSHPGTEIARELGLSRTAVWKIIQRLKSFGAPIQSHPKGYILHEYLSLLDKQKICHKTQNKNYTLDVFESLDSTNDYLKNKENNANCPHFCLAEHQSHGRGRMERSWISPFGRNLYLSLSYTFSKDISELSGLSLVMGVILAKCLESFNPFPNPKLSLSLKWPNDIYLCSEKMGGILIEITAEAHGNCRTIIGIGLNINMKDVPIKDIDQPWTSLEHHLAHKVDRNIIVARVIDATLEGLESFSQNGMDAFRNDWQKYDILHNKAILLKTSRGHISGMARGINELGHLLIELPSGVIQGFSSGDTSVMKT